LICVVSFIKKCRFMDTSEPELLLKQRAREYVMG
jgi:hypothetical protein